MNAFTYCHQTFLACGIGIFMSNDFSDLVRISALLFFLLFINAFVFFFTVFRYFHVCFVRVTVYELEFFFV